jgi:hypothetical protein
VTPEQERALLDAAAAGVDDEVRAAYRELVDLIREGVPPRAAVEQVIESFQGEFAEIMSSALSATMATSIGAAAALEITVGGVSLSRHLYAQASIVSNDVQAIVANHAVGFQDARRLALELFEGYTFRPPDAEPLQFSRNNPALPKYLREALLTDDDMAGQMQRLFARIQAGDLSTGALRAAYSELLDALDNLQDDAGRALLEKRMEVAFYERMRYFATRIARTELHRAYMQREALILMDDEAIQYVQVRRAPGGEPCICSLFAGRDLYGLGAGVYPKAAAPMPPYHPFCRCVVSPRLDLNGRTAKDRDEAGNAYFLSRLDQSVAARVVGSRAKLEQALAGTSPEAIANGGRDPLYWVRTVGSAAP